MRAPIFLAIDLIVVPSAFAQRPRIEEVRELRQTIDASLVEEMTKRWFPRTIEPDGGGFHQTYARDWTPLPDSDRSLVFQARMTWTAAAFARYSHAHRDEYAGYAKKGVEYLDRTMRDGLSGGFHWILGPDGKVSPSLGTQKHIYGTAFVLDAVRVSSTRSRTTKTPSKSPKTSSPVRRTTPPRAGGSRPTREPRKVTPWKANYHTGRALMNVSTMLGAMEKAEGSK